MSNKDATREGAIHPLAVQRQRLMDVLEDFYAFMGFKPNPGELEEAANRLVDTINRGEDGKSYQDRLFLRWFARELEARGLTDGVMSITSCQVCHRLPSSLMEVNK